MPWTLGLRRACELQLDGPNISKTSLCFRLTSRVTGEVVKRSMSLHLRTPSLTGSRLSALDGQVSGQKAKSAPSSVYSIFITPQPAQRLEPSSRRRTPHRKGLRLTMLIALLLGVFFVLEWRCLSSLGRKSQTTRVHVMKPGTSLLQGKGSTKRSSPAMFERLLAFAAHALAETDSKLEPDDLWEEPIKEASKWQPCADKRPSGYATPPEPKDSSGYVMVSADGGLNQQRVAVCNAVAVARLMNATLLLPKFRFNSVWRDSSQFGDIYQESHFISYLKDDVRIVKELPWELRSLDLAAMGSLLTGADVAKESMPRFYLETVMPILLRNRVVHFLGFENSLSFDPIPPEIQRLRCRCNFHALKFVARIQETAGIMITRMRDNNPRWGPLGDKLTSPTQDTNIEKILLESYSEADRSTQGERGIVRVGENRSVPNRYLSLHLRFEIDMAAYSLCNFGGGEVERQELQAFREIHFPTLNKHHQSGKLTSAEALREEGKCPLTPEEAVLMLAALGFKRNTRIFLAGAHIYGGEERMAIISNLYPNIVTKEDLLTAEELAPFTNHSSQMAALDFIGCATANAFAMTDSGSQLSSLVSGYRIYFGRGYLPSIRPNKRRLAMILSSNMTIEWEDFEERVRKTVRESKRVLNRPTARSVYRHPRCKECMCH